MNEQKTVVNYNDKIKAIKDDVRFYISTPERAAEALLFVRELERFAEEVKSKVKERATEIMDKQGKELVEYSITDPVTGEIREWELRRDYGTQTKEYRPENVYKVLGDDAFKFFKVGKIAIEKYLAKLSAKGDLPMEKVTEALADPEMKLRKGSGVKIREIKAK